MWGSGSTGGRPNKSRRGEGEREEEEAPDWCHCSEWGPPPSIISVPLADGRSTLGPTAGPTYIWKVNLFPFTPLSELSPLLNFLSQIITLFFSFPFLLFFPFSSWTQIFLGTFFWQNVVCFLYGSFLFSFRNGVAAHV